MYLKQILKIACAFVLMTVCQKQLSTQTRTITGLVVSDSARVPLAEATITVKGLSNTVLSNKDGRFAIKVPEGKCPVEDTFPAVFFTCSAWLRKFMRLTTDLFPGNAFLYT